MKARKTASCEGDPHVFLNHVNLQTGTNSHHDSIINKGEEKVKQLKYEESVEMPLDVLDVQPLAGYSESMYANTDKDQSSQTRVDSY